MVKKAHSLAITQGNDRILLSIGKIWEWPETVSWRIRAVVLVETYLLVPLNRSVSLLSFYRMCACPASVLLRCLPDT
jgi:hypothetical protein